LLKYLKHSLTLLLSQRNIGGSLMADGFKGYDFDPVTQQPRWVREWRTAGTGTEHIIYRQGQIGPFMKFTVSRLGKRIEHDLTPRSWIQHLYPSYPRLVTKSGN
jgi:hypothetical protein